MPDIAFGRPELLYLLVLLPLSGGLYLLTFWWKRSRLRLFGGALGLRSSSASLARQAGKALLVLVALALLVLTAAAPQWGFQLRPVTQQGVDVIVALDVSLSMAAQDTRPSRLEAAKQEIRRLLERLSTNRVGIVLFAGSGVLRFPLTNDKEAASGLLNDTGPNFVPRPGTSLAEGIRAASSAFDFSNDKPKVLVVVSDGEDQLGDELVAAREAALRNVVIYAIGVGTQEGGQIPLQDKTGKSLGVKRDASGAVVVTRLEEDGLKEVASVTRGRYWRYTIEGTEVRSLVDEIKTIETTEFASDTQVRPEERFQWFAVAALGILVVEFLLGERRAFHRRELSR